MASAIPNSRGRWFFEQGTEGAEHFICGTGCNGCNLANSTGVVSVIPTDDNVQFNFFFSPQAGGGAVVFTPHAKARLFDWIEVDPSTGEPWSVNPILQHPDTCGDPCK